MKNSIFTQTIIWVLIFLSIIVFVLGIVEKNTEYSIFGYLMIINVYLIDIQDKLKNK